MQNILTLVCNLKNRGRAYTKTTLPINVYPITSSQFKGVGFEISLHDKVVILCDLAEPATVLQAIHSYRECENNNVEALIILTRQHRAHSSEHNELYSVIEHDLMSLEANVAIIGGGLDEVHKVLTCCNRTDSIAGDVFAGGLGKSSINGVLFDNVDGVYVPRSEVYQSILELAQESK